MLKSNNKNMRKAVAIVFVAIILISLSAYLIIQKRIFGKDSFSDNIEPWRKTGFFDLKNRIIEEFRSFDRDDSKNIYWTQAGITSHHLPLAVDFISDFYKSFFDSDGPREVFIVFGPDHFEKCSSLISSTKKPYLTPFGVINIDEEILRKLEEIEVGIDENCFEGEHSTAVQAIFIKHLFPDAKIVPLLVSSRTGEKNIKEVVSVLSEYRDKISIISSVDFSHYRDYKEAVFLDNISEQAIKNINGASLSLKYVDSPSSVKLAMLFAKMNNLNNGVVFGRANSFDFSGEKENTTGYINAFFSR